MIRDEAEKLSRLLTERFALQAPGVLAEVEAMSNRIEFAAPGGGRPTLVRPPSVDFEQALSVRYEPSTSADQEWEGSSPAKTRRYAARARLSQSRSAAGGR